MVSDTAKAGRGFSAVLGFLIAAAIFAYYASYTSFTLREADLWWHIRTGQDILSTFSVPYVETYTHSYEGQPWIAKEWLSQVLYAMAYNVAGWAGPLMLASASVALAGWVFYRRAVVDLQPFYAAALTIFCLFMIQVVTVARPVVFIFPVAILFTIQVFDAARANRAPSYATALLLLLWVNLHNTFPLAVPIAGIAFLNFLENTRLKDRRGLVNWFIFFGLCGLAMLANPYFIKPFVIALTMAHDNNTRQYTTEWFSLDAKVDFIIEGGILVALFLLLKARARLAVSQILFVLFTLHLMLSYIRFTFLFFLLAPFAVITEAVLAQPGASFQNWLKRPRDKLEAFVDRNARNVSVALAAVMVLFAGSLLRPGAVIPPEGAAISGALNFIKSHRDSDPALRMKVFNEDFFGGALILSGIKTYIDGRTDQLFIGDFVEKYVASGDKNDPSALNEILSDQSIGWTIFPVKDVRNAHIAKLPDWQKVYEDKVAIIFERKLQ